MKNGEKLLRISPDARELETGRGGERAETLDRVLVGKLGNDFLPGLEMKFVSAEVNGLRPLADQVHLDAMRLLIVDGAMPPLREIKIRAQFAIRPHQHIEIEERGHPRAVVVSGFQNLRAIFGDRRR